MRELQTTKLKPEVVQEEDTMESSNEEQHVLKKWKLIERSPFSQIRSVTKAWGGATSILTLEGYLIHYILQYLEEGAITDHVLWATIRVGYS